MKKIPIAAGREHSADDRCAHDLPGNRTCSARRPQWNAAEDKREGCHQDRAQPQPRAFECGVGQRSSIFVPVLGELDDQNCVLRRQADQHDQADLRVDVAFNLHHVGRQENAEQNASQPQHDKSSKHRHRRAEQYAERQRPAFIKCRKNQKDEQQRQPEDGAGGTPCARFLFQIGDARVVESHLSRHGLSENFFKGCGRLIGAVARRCAAVDLRATVLVKAHRKFGAELRLDRGERGQRNAFALIVADIEAADVIGAGAILALGFDIDLPLAAKAIEIIDEIAAHERLDGAVHIGKIDALLQYFVAIDVDKLLRNAGQKSRTQAGDLRPLSRRLQKRASDSW